MLNAPKDMHKGDTVSATWGRAVNRFMRRGLNAGVECVETPDGFQQLPPQRQEDATFFMVVCKGPNNEAAPTNENYWLQRIDILAKDADTQDDPSQVNEVALREPVADIVLGFNTQEIWTHTHAVKTGEIVKAHLRYDLNRNPRWVFSVVPFLFTILFGGQFTAWGCQPCQGLSFLYVDHWSERTPVQPFKHSPAFGGAADYAYFEGVHWAAGAFSLPDPDNPGTLIGYALARWDDTTKDWIGISLGGGTGGTGKCLFVWQGHLYFSCAGGAGGGAQDADLVQIDYDPDTEEVTVTDIGWHDDVGSAAVGYQMIAWDDGQGGGEQLYVVGKFAAPQPDVAGPHLARWNGTTWSFIGDCGSQYYDCLYDLCVHDFEDDVGERLVVTGVFETIGGLSGSDNVACWNPVANQWEEMAGGRTVASHDVVGRAVASFNHRLWCSISVYDPNTALDSSTLDALENGPNRVWRPSSAIVHDMGEGSAGETVGFFKTIWNGTSNTTGPGQIASMTVYQNRLHLVGDFIFRAVKRGRTYSGPFVRQDPSSDNNDFYPCAPIVRGKPHAMCSFEGGIVVAGRLYKGLPDSGTLRNIGLWRCPSGMEDEGTWDNLAGGVNGEVWAVCVYRGELYAAGDFTEAGGVAVKGLARWDGTGWNYVANFSDYGTIRALCVAGDLLFVGGNFSRADGQSIFGYLCTWNGRSLGDAYTTIGAADDAPFIRALTFDGTDLYAGGWFDDLDGTAHSIAKAAVTGSTRSAWTKLEKQSTGSDGFSTGTVWTIASMQGKVYVGTDAGSLPQGTTTGAAPLWIYTTSTKLWSTISNVIWGSVPIKCIWSSIGGTTAYAGVSLAVNLPQYHEAGGPKHRVLRMPSAGGWYTIGGDKYCFDDPVDSVALIDAGFGEKVYAGASGSKTGGVPGPVGQPCQCIVSIDEGDNLVDVCGGVGLDPYAAQFFGGAQEAVRARAFQFDDQPCETLAVVGMFSCMNEGYGAQLAGIDLRGNLVGVRGGVAGSWAGNQTGAVDGPYDIKAVPRAEWPDHWTSLPCDPDEKLRWLICGSFSHAWNNQVRDCDADTAREYFSALGLVCFAGGYMIEAIPEGQFASFLSGVVECYANKIVAAGAEGGNGVPPRYYLKTGETTWDFPYLKDPWTTGGLNADYSSQFNALIRWEGLLFVLGLAQLFPDVGTGEPFFAVSSWDGTDYTGEEPTGFPSSDGYVKSMKCATVADLGDGEYLYCGGQANDASSTCPVVRRDKAGAWSAVGGDTKLRGICYGLAAVTYAEGRVLVATGDLSVPDGVGGWTSCAVAMWDGTDWTAIGWIGLSDVIDRPCAIADTGGFAWMDSTLKRAIVGGNVGEISDEIDDVGTGDATQVFGLAQWTRSLGWSRNAGINGQAFCAGSAQAILFPRERPA